MSTTRLHRIVQRHLACSEYNPSRYATTTNFWRTERDDSDSIADSKRGEATHDEVKEWNGSRDDGLLRERQMSNRAGAGI
jgi:hypothetical protein